MGVCALLLVVLWATDASCFFYNSNKRPPARGIFESRDIVQQIVLRRDPLAFLQSKKTRGAGKLHVVIAHYAEDTVEQTVEWWSGFLKIAMVDELQPKVYIYCQNPNLTDPTPFQQLMRHGGDVIHLDNLGREGHAFLVHITKNYDDLPDHVLFSQDIAMDVKLWHRFQNMFEPKTGFLPLALVGHQICDDQWLPKGMMQQLYSMLTQSLCPPEGFTASYNGQFVVSRKRILGLPWWTYRHLLELVGASEDHWIHETHTNAAYKQPDNPFFGHVLERSWSLAFNCYESWRAANCWACDEGQGMKDCGPGACQCYDID